MKDVKCPYCGEEQDINHEDGYDYDEGETFQQDCKSCGKTFAYETERTFSYDVHKADCLNGGKHKWQPTRTTPQYATKMFCTECGKYRNPTDKECKKYNIPTFREYFDKIKKQQENL